MIKVTNTSPTPQGNLQVTKDSVFKRGTCLRGKTLWEVPKREDIVFVVGCHEGEGREA